MPNGKALQVCTSHDIGQNFAKSFDWTVQDKNGDKVNPWQNSWGFSTRSIGGLIMVHGDDSGLVFPPQIAPTQIIIVPIPAHELAKELSESIYKNLKNEFRTEIDLAEQETAGFKFNKWEMKGVPIRIEIGDREAKENKVVLFRRDIGEKMIVDVKDLNSNITEVLKDIQNELFLKHKKFTLDNTFKVDTYEEFKKIMNTTKGFISALWCEDAECESKIKEETKATTRCLPLENKPEEGVCVCCGRPANHRWLFAQSY
jgi:prolyl-tRNA synthetase